MKPYFESAGVTLWHGDCRDFIPSLAKSELCLTDAPYSMKHVDGGGFASARKFYRDGALDGLCDFKLEDYANALAACADEFVGFHSRDQIGEYATFCKTRLGNYDLHVWHKTNAIPFTCNTWKSDLEYIALGWRKKKHLQVPQHEKSKLWQSSLERGGLHPTQKPMALMHKYIRVLDAQTVIDPFCGSGTTLIAALTLGRKCIGIERDEAHCATATRRIERWLAQGNLFQPELPQPTRQLSLLGESHE